MKNKAEEQLAVMKSPVLVSEFGAGSPDISLEKPANKIELSRSL